MRYLPQVNWCATLNALFPGQGGLLAETFAHLSPDRAEQVVETRGQSLNERFKTLSSTEIDAALHALGRYRAHTLAGNL